MLYQKRFNLLKNFHTVRFNFSTDAVTSKICICGREYSADEFTNITPKILSYLGKNLLLQPYHPLGLLYNRMKQFFYKRYTKSGGNPEFAIFDQLLPIVSTGQNFDSLCIAEDHVSRQKRDNFYVNHNYLLRSHMTAHQAELIKMGLDSFLYAGDVYRRDEIDSSHFPVFHQMDGVRLFSNDNSFSDYQNNLRGENVLESSKSNKMIFPKETNIVDVVSKDLLECLTALAYYIFGDDAELRWVEAYFPFTIPSWELEVKCPKKSIKGYEPQSKLNLQSASKECEENWMELLGCGIIKQDILHYCGAQDKVGWAFGLGLERWAMKVYDIPDIRLFRSEDSRFLDQFKVDDLTKPIKFKPFSTQPPLFNDISFWLPDNQSFHANDFCDLVRNIDAALIEQVALIDEFVHPKTKQSSQTYRITYRSWERPLSQDEVRIVHKKICEKASNDLGVHLRI